MIALIPVGGKGTRLKPLTDVTDKALLKVHGLSLLKIALREASRATIDSAYVVSTECTPQVRQAARSLEQRTHADWHVNVRSVQGMPGCLLRSLLFATSSLPPQPWFVILPDEIFADGSQLLCDMRERGYASGSAVAALNNLKFSREAKPENLTIGRLNSSESASCDTKTPRMLGRFFFPASVVTILRECANIDFYAFLSLLATGGLLAGKSYDGGYWDVGTIPGYRAACADQVLRSLLSEATLWSYMRGRWICFHCSRHSTITILLWTVSRMRFLASISQLS
jgi:GTP:adenosylcobinamide-phosphate guanylyltransferase